MHERTRSAWLISVFFALIAAGCPAHAQGQYSVSVEDEWGAPLRTYEAAGQRYVLASYGQRYAIVVRNHTGRRVEAVVSVDGRDVVSGRVADFARERGYVLEPYATLRIEGFRKSYSEVAAFRFSAPDASYSSRMGTPENVGVIGAAFFPERSRPAPPRPIAPAEPQFYEGERRESSARHKSAEAAPPSAARGAAAPAAADRYVGSAASESVNNLGTEYGESRSSQVEEVRFVRASSSTPAYVAVLRYDDADGLIARGIELAPRRVSRVEPQAFPRNRFAPPPP
ncbi:MAG TPA: hypothetical protein VJR89_14870 [Polyangiales bacterium]|nr:hypothetical protein [Polyangiales bacterium]